MQPSTSPLEANCKDQLLPLFCIASFRLRERPACFAIYATWTAESILPATLCWGFHTCMCCKEVTKPSFRAFQLCVIHSMHIYACMMQLTGKSIKPAKSMSRQPGFQYHPEGHLLCTCKVCCTTAANAIDVICFCPVYFWSGFCVYGQLSL